MRGPPDRGGIGCCRAMSGPGPGHSLDRSSLAHGLAPRARAGGDAAREDRTADRYDPGGYSAGASRQVPAWVLPVTDRCLGRAWTTPGGPTVLTSTHLSSIRQTCGAGAADGRFGLSSDALRQPSRGGAGAPGGTPGRPRPRPWQSMPPAPAPHPPRSARMRRQSHRRSPSPGPSPACQTARSRR